MAFKGKAQAIAVEGQARLGVGDADGGVIKPFGQARWNLSLVPAGIAFIGGELQQLQWMPIRIFELEGLNASCRQVVWK